MKSENVPCGCQPLAMPYLNKQDTRTYLTYRRWWRGNPPFGAVLIRSRMSGFSTSSMDDIIYRAIKHIRDVVAFGHDFLGEEPTHFKDGKYLERELQKLEPLVEQGSITWPIEGTPQSYQVHRMCLSLYGYLNEDLSPPARESDEWADIFIYQYDDPNDWAWGRADIGYYQTFKHYNIRLNEAKMRDNSDVRKWSSVIFHEMMHNWGWGHDDNRNDRSEYIYHADQILEDLVPA